MARRKMSARVKSIICGIVKRYGVTETKRQLREILHSASASWREQALEAASACGKRRKARR